MTGCFTYTENGIPKITAINPTSSSPVLKTPIVIDGINFDSNKANLKVFLDNSTHQGIYELGIVQSNDT